MRISKEDKVIELFFDEPTRQWHFEEILKKSKITRKPLVHWLSKFLKETLVKRIKPRGQMPYYLANHASPDYKNLKRIFALNTLYKSGFLNHLMQLSRAKTVILFGSMTRSDWHKNSDIDLFIYGDTQGLEVGKYKLALNRDIQLFDCQTRECLKKFPEGLIKNILKGNLIKGNIDFLKVNIND